MIPDAVLDQAVGKGLISHGQALALRSLARQEAPPAELPPATDPERLRFVSGFGDIFVTLGVGLFLGAAATLGSGPLGEGGAAALVAALAWILAEFFTRKRRMALPSIALLLIFAGAAFLALAAALATGTAGPAPRLGWLRVWLNFGLRDATALAGAALGTALLVALHYARFRVPVTVAAGTAALLLAVLLGLYVAEPAWTERSVNPILLAGGLVAFGLAMRFDLRDPERLTRRTDIAFWLHLLAAPLIVHSVFASIGATRVGLTPGAALLVLAVFGLLGIVAVLADRRALLVSGLVYAGVAFGSLIREAGISGNAAPLTLLALGAFVLLLSAGWTPLRRAMLSRLSPDLADRLPRPTPT